MSKASVYLTLGHIKDETHNVKKIKQELDALPGVTAVSVNDDSGRVAVDFDTTAIQSGRIERQLEEMGYKIVDSKLDSELM